MAKCARTVEATIGEGEERKEVGRRLSRPTGCGDVGSLIIFNIRSCSVSSVSVLNESHLVALVFFNGQSIKQ